MAFAVLFLDGEGAAFGGEWSAGCGRRSRAAGPARRRRLCLRFRLRAKGGSAVVGGRQGAAEEGRAAGRPCGEAARRPPPEAGGGLRPSGAERLPAVCLRQGGIWGGGYACAFWRFCQRR